MPHIIYNIIYPTFLENVVQSASHRNYILVDVYLCVMGFLTCIYYFAKFLMISSHIIVHNYISIYYLSTLICWCDSPSCYSAQVIYIPNFVSDVLLTYVLYYLPIFYIKCMYILVTGCVSPQLQNILQRYKWYDYTFADQCHAGAFRPVNIVLRVYLSYVSYVQGIGFNCEHYITEIYVVLLSQMGTFRPFGIGTQLRYHFLIKRVGFE